MKKSTWIAPLIAGLLLLSCGGGKTDQATAANPEVSASSNGGASEKNGEMKCCMGDQQKDKVKCCMEDQKDKVKCKKSCKKSS